MNAAVLCICGILVGGCNTQTLACLSRRRATVAAAVVILAVLAYRAAILAKSRLWELMPVPFFAPIPSHVQPAFLYLAKHSYLGLAARQGPLWIGVLAALAVIDSAARQQIRRCAFLIPIEGCTVMHRSSQIGGLQVLVRLDNPHKCYD